MNVTVEENGSGVGAAIRWLAGIASENVNASMRVRRMGVVMDLADRVLVLDFGIQVACDTPGAVQRDPNVVRAYLGVEHASAEQVT